MKFGIVINSVDQSFENILNQANKAEKCGFYSIFIPDHAVWQPPLPGMCFDALNLLSAIAMQTKLQLCTGVSDCHRIHPALMAQKFATLDHISNGRAMFGIGSGEKMNVDMYGLSRAKSLAKLKEYIELMRQFWTKKKVSKKSEFWGDIKKAFIQIKPKQKSIPIYVAANGPKTRQLTGILGDGWYPCVESPWTYKENKKDVVNSAKNAGRDPDEIDYALLNFVAIDDKNPENAKEECNTLLIGSLIYYSKKINQIYPHLNIPTEIDVFNFDMNSDIQKLLAFRDNLPESTLSDSMPIGTTDEVIATIEKFKDAGVTHMALTNYGPDMDNVFEIFRDKIIPYFKEEDK